MKKYSLVVFFSIICSTLIFSNTCSASDELGCLTCHGYPGLVKFEKPDHFKVLHIDEEKHLDSKHGKVDCRQCHTPVSKVPHTGNTGVECTTKCHLEDKDKIIAMQSSLSTFHKDEKFAITRLNDTSSCRVCHPLYPHSENNKVRAFLNMHTGYLSCEVCHLKKEDIKNIVYDWKSPDAFEFTGEPYGTHKKQEAGETRKTEDVISRMLKIFSPGEDQPKNSSKSEYLLSRIAAFSEENGEKRMLINTKDVEKAREYKAKEKKLNPEAKEAELKYFHKDIARKEISIACNECHSINGMLDFRKLGFNEKRAEDLEYMNIKSLITKYDVFYLPHLF